ncbi:7677_t:CDS:2 [Cetraspora pellucida]|uniref:7677_t:CDS:1 n=1 Tax=Cetraspora pellucida TaxID=1433469 RepID=A0ACA9L4A7_9GLOM|nr:7677_t:CDS:2 [Cetraspora pellucida]
MTKRRINVKKLNVRSNIRPKFPPNINVPQCIEESVKKYQEGDTRRTSNAFLLYRSQFIAEFSRVNNCNLAATKISPLAKQSWCNEPIAVQNYYKEIAIKIKEGVRKQIPFSFVNNQKNLKSSNIIDDGSVGVAQAESNFCHTVEPVPVVDSTGNSPNLIQSNTEITGITENTHNLHQFDSFNENAHNLVQFDTQTSNNFEFLPYWYDIIYDSQIHPAINEDSFLLEVFLKYPMFAL